MAQAINELRRSEHVHNDPNAKRLYPEDVTADEIEEDIEHTRAAMDDTLSELFQRLAPKSLLGDALGIIRESMRSRNKRGRKPVRRRGDYEYEDDDGDDEPGIAKRAATAVGKQAFEIVKNHPLPSALITAGVVWMVMEPDRETRAINRRMKKFEAEIEAPTVADSEQHGPSVTQRMRQGAEHARERIGEKAHDMRERVGDAAHSMRERVSHAGEKVGNWAHHSRERMMDAKEYLSERASHVGESVREGMHRTRDTYDRAMDQYPLAVAAGAIGIGVLAGLLLPRTRTEDRYMGEAADELKERSRDIGREAAERGGEIAEHAASTAAEEAGEASKEMLSGSSSQTSERTGQSQGQQQGDRFRGLDR